MDDMSHYFKENGVNYRFPLKYINYNNSRGEMKPYITCKLIISFDVKYHFVVNSKLISHIKEK
jgi:hypothetical protein